MKKPQVSQLADNTVDDPTRPVELILGGNDFTSITAALVTLTAIWWTIEGLGLLALGHTLKIASPQSVRLYALSNIPALLIGLFLIIAGILGHAEPTP